VTTAHELVENAIEPPRVLPVGWCVDARKLDGYRLVNSITRMSVIASIAVELDGKRWVHVSVARPDRMPSWEDLVWVKEFVLGRESTALQVIPPRSRYVNQHPFCLHLWQCFDGDVTPDFTQGGNTL
jgi:hypothetical protein